MLSPESPAPMVRDSDRAIPGTSTELGKGGGEIVNLGKGGGVPNFFQERPLQRIFYKENPKVNPHRKFQTVT